MWKEKLSSVLWPTGFQPSWWKTTMYTSVQKARIGGFSGCLENVNIIWHQVKTAKKEKKDLHVVSSRSSQCLRVSVTQDTLDGVQFLPRPRGHNKACCVTTKDSTTAWQHLEIEIMAGYTISPLAFTMAVEMIIRASRWEWAVSSPNQGLYGWHVDHNNKATHQPSTG